MVGSRHRARELPYGHMPSMVYHMKTTLNIDDTVMDRLRAESARTGRTMGELVETALRLLLEKRRPAAPELPPIRTRGAGAPRVDVDDRNALFDIMQPTRRD